MDQPAFDLPVRKQTVIFDAVPIYSGGTAPDYCEQLLRDSLFSIAAVAGRSGTQGLMMKWLNQIRDANATEMLSTFL
jgi:hypothetical protein